VKSVSVGLKMRSATDNIEVIKPTRRSFISKLRHSLDRLVRFDLYHDLL